MLLFSVSSRLCRMTSVEYPTTLPCMCNVGNGSSGRTWARDTALGWGPTLRNTLSARCDAVEAGCCVASVRALWTPPRTKRQRSAHEPHPRPMREQTPPRAEPDSSSCTAPSSARACTVRHHWSSRHKAGSLRGDSGRRDAPQQLQPPCMEGSSWRGGRNNIMTMSYSSHRFEGAKSLRFPKQLAPGNVPMTDDPGSPCNPDVNPDIPDCSPTPTSDRFATRPAVSKPRSSTVRAPTSSANVLSLNNAAAAGNLARAKRKQGSRRCLPTCFSFFSPPARCG